MYRLILSVVLAATFVATGCEKQQISNKQETENKANSMLTYKDLSQYAFDTFQMDDGMNVNYRVDGTDNEQTILLIHGGSDSLNVWDRWVEPLKQKYKVIRLDLPGHGLTDPFPDKQYDTKRLAEFLHRFVTEYGLKDFVLVGHSYGGETSLHYMTRHPNTVKALGLVGSGGIEPEWADIKEYIESFNRSFSPGRQGTKEGLEIAFHDPNSIPEDVVEYSFLLGQYEKNQGTLQALEAASSEKYQNVENFEIVSVPTILFWGDKDKIANLENVGRRLEQAIPNAELVVYKDVGHMPIVEVAEQSVADFMDFLDANL